MVTPGDCSGDSSLYCSKNAVTFEGGEYLHLLEWLFFFGV